MNVLDPARFSPHAAVSHFRQPRTAREPGGYELAGIARQAVLCARQHLLNQQRPDGSWQGLTQGDVTHASQVLLLACYLGERSARWIDDEQVEQLADSILTAQLPQGGWSRTPDGPVDVSASVQAYLALRLAGHEAATQPLRAARRAILAAGGADRCDSITRFWLALTGQLDFADCPVLAPEMLLMRRGEGLGGGRLPGSDELTLVLPALALVWSHRPQASLRSPVVRGLFVKQPHEWPAPADVASCGWLRDRLLRLVALADAHGWVPLRKQALDRAEEEIRRRLSMESLERSTLLEAVWLLVALDCIGFSPDSEEVQLVLARLRTLVNVDGKSGIATCQPHVSPLADTASAIEALSISGLPPHELQRAAAHVDRAAMPGEEVSSGPLELAAFLECLAAMQQSDRGGIDSLPPAISVFVDEDQLDALDGSPIATGGSEPFDAAAAPIVSRLRQLQHDAGSWGVAARGAGATGGSPEVTGAVLAALARWRTEDVDEAIAGGVAYLCKSQRADGSWDNGDGSRSIGSTSHALRGLLAAGVSQSDATAAAAIEWLLVEQHADGSWSEPGDLSSGFPIPEGSPTETAWAVRALLAAGLATSETVLRGVNFLVSAQQADGGWHERRFVMGGPPAGRNFVNELTATTEPMAALSQWMVAFSIASSDAPYSLRVVGTN